MISEKLREARKYEEKAEKQIKEDERPKFHLSTRIGWMNDPNGFSYYNGKYHMFYQYHPYETKWGPMHWGHAVSTDLLHWQYLPAALAPDEVYDCAGCFSGSALTLSDGKQLLMYTGVIREKQEDGTIRDVQTQCVATGNGIDYEKYEKNPVIDQKSLPEGASRFDFRDPKIWQKEDGTYRCITGNRPADGSGQILMFSSSDGFHWSFEKIFAENNNRFGKMWECPDFFEIDGKGVLLTSPQDMLPLNYEYYNGNVAMCLIGEYDDTTDTFIPQKDQCLDYGIDFYAPQTVLTPDGRRVMIGWMQNWDTCSICEPERVWFGQMSLPRELFLKNGRLCQKPVRELEGMRANKISYCDISFSNTLQLKGIKGRAIDMELTIQAEKEQPLFRKFTVQFAQNEKYHTSISFYPEKSILKIDRKSSGSRRAIMHQRKCKVNCVENTLKLRIILDRFSVEVFANDGEQVMTATLYTEQSADNISFVADGSVKMDVIKYDLIG